MFNISQFDLFASIVFLLVISFPVIRSLKKHDSDDRFELSPLFPIAVSSVLSLVWLLPVLFGQ